MLFTYHIVDVINSHGVVSDGILPVILEMLTVAVSTLFVPTISLLWSPAIRRTPVAPLSEAQLTLSLYEPAGRVGDCTTS